MANQAQVNLGCLYLDGLGVKRNYNEAVRLFRLAAQKGQPVGQYNLAYCYQKGYGVRQDYAEAVKWFRKSAEQGNTGAELQLGEHYANGHGIEQDYAEAAQNTLFTAITYNANSFFKVANSCQVWLIESFLISISR